MNKGLIPGDEGFVGIYSANRLEVKLQSIFHSSSAHISSDLLKGILRL